MTRAMMVVALGALAACSSSEKSGGDGGAGDLAMGGDAAADGSLPNANGDNLQPGYPNLDLPNVGQSGLRVIAPTVLELTHITT